jgi:branched-chain amino acid transport system permease protein
VSGRREFLAPLVIFGLLAFLPLFLSDFWKHQAILVLMWAYLATSWNILGGYAGQHSLGHGLYLGVGAYGAAYLFNVYDLTPWVSLILMAGLAAALAAFVGYAVFRYGLRGAYFALVTIALAEAAVYIASNWRAMGGAGGLRLDFVGHRPELMQFQGKNWYFYIILILLAGSVLLTQWLAKNRFGYQLVAVRENEEAAEALGVNTLSTKIKANVLSAAMTAVGGVFFVQYIAYVGPRTVFGEIVSVQILLYAIIGGLGTVWGPAVGALILVPTAEIARSQLGDTFQGAHLLVYGVVLVLVMLFMPKGIVGAVKGLGSRWPGRGAAGSAPLSPSLPSQEAESFADPGSTSKGGGL